MILVFAYCVGLCLVGGMFWHDTKSPALTAVAAICYTVAFLGLVVKEDEDERQPVEKRL